jgi:ABC-type lipoprotein release transport system permease subunit
MSPVRLLRRLAYWWRFRAQQDELREELAVHRELLAADLGLLVAVAVTRVLASFLYQVRPADPAALGVAVLLLVIVALIATLVPVRRALRIDPMDALRTD